MNTLPLPNLVSANPSMGEYCLVDLASNAENEKMSVEDRPDLATALDSHVVMDSSDGAAELMCKRCPVMCSITRVGGSAIVLLQDSEKCAKRC